MPCYFSFQRAFLITYYFRCFLFLLLILHCSGSIRVNRIKTDLWEDMHSVLFMKVALVLYFRRAAVATRACTLKARFEIKSQAESPRIWSCFHIVQYFMLFLLVSFFCLTYFNMYDLKSISSILVTFQWPTFWRAIMSHNIVKAIKSRRLRWAGHVARMEEGRGAFKILIGKPTGNRPLGRTRHRYEGNIRMYLNRYKDEKLG